VLYDNCHIRGLQFRNGSALRVVLKVMSNAATERGRFTDGDKKSFNHEGTKYFYPPGRVRVFCRVIFRVRYRSPDAAQVNGSRRQTAAEFGHA